MMIWFAFLSLTGIAYLDTDLEVLLAFNLVRGIQLLFSSNNIMSLSILGSVFLATTCAEAIFADIGHVEKKSIYISCPFVKISLILNYLCQGAFIIHNIGNIELMELYDLNQFYEMLPSRLKILGIGLAKCLISI